MSLSNICIESERHNKCSYISIHKNLSIQLRQRKEETAQTQWLSICHFQKLILVVLKTHMAYNLRETLQ